MKGTVLVVDDERNQREILGAILKSEGYIPLLASGGPRRCVSSSGRPSTS